MAKITQEQIKNCYQLGKEIYLREITPTKAIDIMTDKFSMNYASAMFYIYNVSCMLDGKKYSRTMPAWPTEYYISNIKNDFPLNFPNALLALEKHLDYYESQPKGGPQREVRRVLEKYKQSFDETHPEEISETENLMEGSAKKILVNIYERNTTAKRKCLEYYKCICMVCDFDFFKIYGDIGRDFIHVHHVVDLSTIKKEYKIVPVKDLVPVCPNCHAMLHKEKPAMSVDKLKSIMKLTQNF